MTTYKNIEGKINDTVELSSVCRGEWCRSLESDMDRLDGELYDYVKSGEVNERFCLASISNKIRKTYRNFKPDIRVLQKG